MLKSSVEQVDASKPGSWHLRAYLKPGGNYPVIVCLLWLGALNGFKPPKRQNSRFPLDRQALRLLGSAGSIACAFGSVFAVCGGIERGRVLLLPLLF